MKPNKITIQAKGKALSDANLLSSQGNFAANDNERLIVDRSRLVSSTKHQYKCE